MTDLIGDAQQLLHELDQTAISTTAYDTAWVARVPDADNPSTLAFPKALEWLERNQYPDGSWGSGVRYYHDRVISTLAATIALAESNGSQRAVAIQRGAESVQRNLPHLHRDSFETVGFELIFPTLFGRAQELNLNLPDAINSKYELLRRKKLHMIPPDLIYSRHMTTAHSLEFMGRELDVNKISTLQEENGSIGNSPSATAYFLTEFQDSAAARQYLAEAIELGGGAAPPLHPVEIFNINWVLYNLDIAGLLDDLRDEAKPYLDFLYEAWDDQRGLGLSQQYSVPDLDDTAVAFKLLRQAGYKVDPDVFTAYEMENHFFCFPYERNPSIGVQVHLLDALQACPEYEHQPRMMDKALRFYRSLVYNAYWIDKWHASPFYILSHAVIAAIGYDNEMAREHVECIIASQQPDGSWGYYGSTSEETAYCLQALLKYHSQVEPLDQAVLYHAAQYLYDNYQSQHYPALWIDKCLYAPTQIIRSAIISALWMYENYL